MQWQGVETLRPMREKREKLRLPAWIASSRRGNGLLGCRLQRGFICCRIWRVEDTQLTELPRVFHLRVLNVSSFTQDRKPQKLSCSLSHRKANSKRFSCSRLPRYPRRLSEGGSKGKIFKRLYRAGFCLLSCTKTTWTFNANACKGSFFFVFMREKLGFQT